MSQEDEYKAELTKNGVELPELEEKPEESDKEEPEEKAKEEIVDESKAKAEDEDKDKDHLKIEPKESRKRSIYDEYKDKKSELKTEKELRVDAEKQRDELQAKLDAATDPEGTVKDKKEAIEDAIAYAKEVGADPDLVKRIIDDARKGLKPEIDDETKRDLADFKEWKKSNQGVVEKQKFDEEFRGVLPAIKTQFPNASDEEIEAIKTKLFTTSHTKEWHDKDLDYIVFKNAKDLSALVSPKKRGMEQKGRTEVDSVSTEFNPTADLSKMTLKERDAWETEYRNAGKSEGLVAGKDGKRIFI